MILTTKQEYTEPQAKREAIDILEEEANQLAKWEDSHRDNPAPHRIQIAISREIQRLRTIANALKP